MIKFLTIKNFQRHQKLRVRLERVTSILGPTDSGKSAILRALRWLALNNLPGDGFIRNGAKSAFVKIKLENGAWIGRGKGKANFYVLNGKKFRSFGQSVPLPISNVLRMNEINFQRQHDSPFWFAESAGQVSRELNRVVDLGIIDTTLAKAVSAVRAGEAHQNAVEGRLRAITEGLEESREATLSRIKQFARLKQTHERNEQIQARRSRLAGILAETGRYRIAEIKEQASEIREVFRIACQQKQTREFAERLDCLIREIETLPGLENRNGDAQEILALGQRLGKLSAHRSALSQLVERIIAQEFALDALNVRHESTVNQLRKVKYCPVCKQKLNSKPN